MSWFRRTPADAARWVAIDCETSGPDAARARLLSVGALAVRAGRIEAGDSFSALIRQERPSANDNILIHGIGGDDQLRGQPPGEAMGALRQFLAESVAVAFHAGFDAQVLRRHGLKQRLQWLDLATLLPALFPGRKASGLDEWLAAFAIAPQARHDALGDAFAAAQLLLVALSEAKRQRAETVEAILQTERAGRWLAQR